MDEIEEHDFKLENDNENENENEAKERPPFLNVLCILSFIVSGILLLALLLIGASKKMSEMAGVDLMDKVRNENPEFFDTPEKIDAMRSMEIMFSWPYLIVSFLLVSISLYGVVKMWNLKKQGFHIYTAAKIMGIVVPVLFGLQFGLMGAFITLAFIVMYYQNTKVMS